MLADKTLFAIGLTIILITLIISIFIYNDTKECQNNTLKIIQQCIPRGSLYNNGFNEDDMI